MKDREMKAKFTLISMNHRHLHGPDEVAVDVVFSAFIGKDADNIDWSKYTPSGEIKMCITNPSALEALELGSDYELFFNKVSAE